MTTGNSYFGSTLTELLKFWARLRRLEQERQMEWSRAQAEQLRANREAELSQLREREKLDGFLQEDHEQPLLDLLPEDPAGQDPEKEREDDINVLRPFDSPPGTYIETLRSWFVRHGQR